MYTANTMASAIEALGLSLPNSSAQAAISAEKRDDCRRAGAAVARLVRDGITPRDILTRKAFENAITVVIALGGSTNAVLHLLAMAHAAKVQADARRLHAHRQARAGAGRSQAERPLRDGRARAHRRLTPLMKSLLDAGLLHGDALTVTGKTLAENLAGVADYPAGQDIVLDVRSPDQEGQPPRHPARQPRARRRGGQDQRQGRRALHRHGRCVFDREEAALDAILTGRVKAGHVIVIRYEGPQGGPGMREMLSPTSAIMGRGLGERCRAHHRRPVLAAAATASSSATSRRKRPSAARWRS